MDNLEQFLEADAPLPCPFCGGEAFLVSSIKIMQSSRYAVRCRDCLVETPSSEDSAHIKRTWNTRIPDRNLLAVFEQVCEVLYKVEHDLAVPTYLREISGTMLETTAPYRKGGV